MIMQFVCVRSNMDVCDHAVCLSVSDPTAMCVSICPAHHLVILCGMNLTLNRTSDDHYNDDGSDGGYGDNGGHEDGDGDGDCW